MSLLHALCAGDAALRRLEEVVYREGEAIIKQGEMGADLFILDEGEEEQPRKKKLVEPRKAIRFAIQRELRAGPSPRGWKEKIHAANAHLELTTALDLPPSLLFGFPSHESSLLLLLLVLQSNPTTTRVGGWEGERGTLRPCTGFFMDTPSSF